MTLQRVAGLSTWILLALLAAPGGAEGEAPVLEWQEGPLLASVGGDLAEIDVPDGPAPK